MFLVVCYVWLNILMVFRHRVDGCVSAKLVHYFFWPSRSAGAVFDQATMPLVRIANGLKRAAVHSTWRKPQTAVICAATLLLLKTWPFAGPINTPVPNHDSSKGSRTNDPERTNAWKHFSKA